MNDNNNSNPISAEEGAADVLRGLHPVDANALNEFLREMNEKVIPEIVEVVEERRLLAAESRQWQLKC